MRYSLSDFDSILKEEVDIGTNRPTSRQIALQEKKRESLKKEILKYQRTAKVKSNNSDENSPKN